MAFEQRENSGTLFKNDKKEEAKHPDYKGEALVNGVQCWISAWIKEGKNGKFMSLAFSPKESRGGQRSSRPAAQSDDDEGAPF
jgi:hypothetical protein